jgi:hypothetical protein
MASISDFKAQMLGGGARPNQFRVELTFPQFIGSRGATAGNAAQFLCRATLLPASTIEDITAAYRGRPVHFAGERTFQPWTITVFNDNNFLIRNVMERWHNTIISYATTTGALRPSDYQVQMAVHQLDRNDRKIKTYTFFDAYPILVGQIQLDFEQNNQIEVFDVEFAYNYFTTDGI